MGIGKRVPISFKEMTRIDQEGGATDESYTVVYNTWAKVSTRSSNRGFSANQVQMTDIYSFSEIRESAAFTPSKTMLISYKGEDLVIESIILDESKAPYYYTINAVKNG